MSQTQSQTKTEPLRERLVKEMYRRIVSEIGIDELKSIVNEVMREVSGIECGEHVDVDIISGEVSCWTNPNIDYKMVDTIRKYTSNADGLAVLGFVTNKPIKMRSNIYFVNDEKLRKLIDVEYYSKTVVYEKYIDHYVYVPVVYYRNGVYGYVVLIYTKNK